MQFQFRLIQMGLVSLVLAISMFAQDRPQDQKQDTQLGSNTTQASPDNSNANAYPNAIPNGLDRSVLNSTETQNSYNDTNQSEMWKSAPAVQNNTGQMLQRVASLTSPDRGSSSSWGGMVWILAIIGACLLALFIVERRPAPREAYPSYEAGGLRRVA